MTFKDELAKILISFAGEIRRETLALGSADPKYKVKPLFSPTATSIINLVDKEVIGKDEDYDHKDSDTKIDFVLAKNELRSEQRAIIRSDNKNKGSE